MSQPAKKRWTLFGASLGAIATLVLVAGIAVFVSSGAAATKAAPTNTSSPVVSGTVMQGQKLHGSLGYLDRNAADHLCVSLAAL